MLDSHDSARNIVESGFREGDRVGGYENPLVRQTLQNAAVTGEAILLARPFRDRPEYPAVRFIYVTGRVAERCSNALSHGSLVRLISLRLFVLYFLLQSQK